MVVVNRSARTSTILDAVRRAFADRDAGGRGNQTFDLRTTIHATTALETALLDLLGQFMDAPVAALLGGGQLRDAVPVLGYLFYVGDRRKTNLPYRSDCPASDEWLRLRDEEAWTTSAIVRPAEAAQKPLRIFRLQAERRCTRGRARDGSRHGTGRTFSNRTNHTDPNGAWSLEEAVRLCRGNSESWPTPKTRAAPKVGTQAARSWPSSSGQPGFLPPPTWSRHR